MRTGVHEVAWHGRTCSGETLSGDAALVREVEDVVLLAIVDALGHGADAHAVARRAVEILRRDDFQDLAGAVRRLHEGLRGSLGAAAGLCRVNLQTGDARWLAVGNVTLWTFGPLETRLAGRDGLLGHVLPTLQEQSLRLPPGGLLVLATDGVREALGAADLRGVLGDSAIHVARGLIERFGREHDDATVAVLRRRT